MKRRQVGLPYLYSVSSYRSHFGNVIQMTTPRKNVCACASTRKMVENLNLFCKAKTVFFIVKGYSSKRKNTVYGQSGHK